MSRRRVISPSALRPTHRSGPPTPAQRSTPTRTDPSWSELPHLADQPSDMLIIGEPDLLHVGLELTVSAGTAFLPLVVPDNVRVRFTLKGVAGHPRGHPGLPFQKFGVTTITNTTPIKPSTHHG